MRWFSITNCSTLPYSEARIRNQSVGYIADLANFSFQREHVGGLAERCDQPQWAVCLADGSSQTVRPGGGWLDGVSHPQGRRSRHPAYQGQPLKFAELCGESASFRNKQTEDKRCVTVRCGLVLLTIELTCLFIEFHESAPSDRPVLFNTDLRYHRNVFIYYILIFNRFSVFS